jgi:hypothetical protein
VARRRLLLDHGARSGLAAHRARDRLLGGLVVPVEDLLVILGQPVDEDAHDDAEILGLRLRDDPVAHRVDDGS